MKDFKEFIMGMNKQLPQDVLMYIYAKYLIGKFKDETINYLCQQGNLEMLAYMSTENVYPNLKYTDQNISYAIKGGYLNIVKWFSDNAPSLVFNPSVMDFAAKMGKLEIVIWLSENSPEGCTTDAMDLAAGNGHLDVVIWLDKNRDEGCTTEAMDSAARKGHLDVVIWLYENRNEGCTTDAMDYAAANGHLEVVKFLDKIGATCTTLAMDLAAENGHLDIVIWLHENRTEGCTQYALVASYEMRDYDIAKFLLINRPQDVEITPRMASLLTYNP